MISVAAVLAGAGGGALSLHWKRPTPPPARKTGAALIQTAAEVTLERPVREDGEYREALTIVNEQSARLSRMVEDMFVLARADAGGYRMTVGPLYVDEIVAECVRAVSVLAT